MIAIPRARAEPRSIARAANERLVARGVDPLLAAFNVHGLTPRAASPKDAPDVAAMAASVSDDQPWRVDPLADWADEGRGWG